MAVRIMNYVTFNHEIIIEKVCRVCIVSQNAAYFGCGHENIFWLIFFEEFLHRQLIS